MRLRKTGLLLLLISSLEMARPLLCSTRLPFVTTALLLIQGSWAKAKAAAWAAFPLHKGGAAFGGGADLLRYLPLSLQVSSSGSLS